MRKFLKPVDVVVVLVVLLCSLLISLLYTDSNAHFAMIYVNGKEYGRYNLNNEKKQVVEISTGYGYNVVVIENKKVSVSETSCKDKVEINAGEISRPGQSLVCLPNRLVVTVEGRIHTDATTF